MTLNLNKDNEITFTDAKQIENKHYSKFKIKVIIT